MISNYNHEKDPSRNFMVVIENQDVVRMYTLLDLDHEERRRDYINFIEGGGNVFSGKEKFYKIKKLLTESSQSDRQYMSFGSESSPVVEILDRRNMFSLFSGTDISLLKEKSNGSEKKLCEKDVVDLVFSGEKDKAILSESLAKLRRYPPQRAEDYRVRFFDNVLSDIENCVDERDDFIWPINVSNTFCFNEPSNKTVHEFAVALFFSRSSPQDSMSEFDSRFINVAEHDAIVKIARLTGLNVVLIDVDAIALNLIHHNDNEIISVVVKKIIDNNNSIIFFKKSSFFYDSMCVKICEEISIKVREVCLNQNDVKYNYIVLSNIKFIFIGAFRKKYDPFFIKNNREYEEFFENKASCAEECETREREKRIKEDLALSVRSPEEINETLDSIIGIKEALDVIGDIILFHNKPEMARKLGVNLSSGILLTGEPGTGKTVVARAMAKELGRKVIMITGSDFSSNRYGDSISKVKMLFELAREIKPCIVFIDEIDGIGNRDNDRMHPEERRVINKFLSEMSEKILNDGIVFIGATNNPKEIDKAIIRDGRFDKKVVVNMPSMEDRKKAFMMFLGKRPVEKFEEIDFDYFAMKTSGMTIATIENIVNQSAILTLRSESELITEKMVEQAILDNRAGGEMSKKPIRPELLKRIAYHEAGHAVIGYHLDVGEVGGVSIIPRANSLGMVFFDVNDDQLALSTEDDLSNHMMVALAGRASEEVFMGNISTGAAGDLEACTKIALSMIQNYGMGDSMVYSYKRGDFNGEIPVDIREKVDLLIKEKYKDVLKVIKKNKLAVKAVAEELVAREVISGKEFIKIIKGD